MATHSACSAVYNCMLHLEVPYFILLYYFFSDIEA